MKKDIRTILCVDDDADDRELLGDIMNKVAPEVIVVFAEDGLQAMDLLQKGHELKNLPCLIVLDLNMPFLDGRQTFERIKANPNYDNIPLVILSTSDSPADKDSFKKGGIPFFVKPVEMSVLKNIAQQMVNICA
ncbi:MAG: response regulator [Ferruginibacter sp.]